MSKMVKDIKQMISKVIEHITRIKHNIEYYDEKVDECEMELAVYEQHLEHLKRIENEK